MSWYFFMLGILATHRIALLISSEDGPGWIFRKLRKLPPPKSSAREGLSCFLCLSLLLGSSLVTAGFWLSEMLLSWFDVGLHWLAFSSGAIMIHMKTTKGIGE